MGLEELLGLGSCPPPDPNMMKMMEAGAREFGKIMGVVPKQINFDPPEFREGMNMTIRRGTYWNANLKKGDAVEVGCEIKNEWKPAIINLVKVKRFEDITSEELACHHRQDFFVENPAHAVGLDVPSIICDKFMLSMAMRKYYENFDDREIVTMIYFTLASI